MSKLFTDSVTLSLFEETEGDSSGLRKVRGSPNLKWSFEVTPKLNEDECAECLSAYIRVVGGPATATGTIVATDSYIKEKESDYDPETTRFKFNFENGEKHGFENIISVECKFYFEVTCNITIMPGGETTVAPTMVHELIELNPGCCDAVIKIGEREIKANRGFLTMLSPEFMAMLNADPENNTITIDDFAYETVERVINNCCGRIVAFNTPESIMEMIRFCEKYNIKPPIAKLQAWLKTNFKVENFFQMADYAWKHSVKPLQDKCGKVFNKHVEKLSHHPDFLQLDPTVVAAIFKAGAATGKTYSRRYLSPDSDDSD
uniref:BTB domain-containing protein n=1 Tax=Panagrellus redivivus TaxID=6233 RepID=A0A7E4W8E8_PANRE